MKKPIIYIITNLGGGVRKSTTIAHLCFALEDAEQEPIIVSLDVNGTLEALLQHGTEVVQWNLNSSEDSYEGLQAVVNLAEETGRPVVIDLAALGGETEGIHTLLETYILEECDVVSVVPVLADAKGVKEAIKALKFVQPQQWMLVLYGTKRKIGIYNRMPEFKELLELKPDAIIRPEELTDSQADILRREPLPLNKIAKCSKLIGPRRRALMVHVNFWEKLRPQYLEALSKLNFTKNVAKSKTAKASSST